MTDKVDNKEIVQLKASVNKKLKRILREIHSEAVENIKKNKSITYGELWRYDNMQILDGGDNQSAVMQFNVPYAYYVEKGTGPKAGNPPYAKKPPFSNIFMWVRKKLGLTNARHKKEAMRRARAVWMSIINNGTEPKPFLAPAVKKIKEKYK